MTAHIDDKQLHLLEELARLRIDPARIAEFQEDLGRMLALIDDLQQANTEGVEPLTNPCDDSQRLRADEVREENQRDLFQQNAPRSEAGLYLVPQVVDN